MLEDRFQILLQEGTLTTQHSSYDSCPLQCPLRDGTPFRALRLPDQERPNPPHYVRVAV